MDLWSVIYHNISHSINPSQYRFNGKSFTYNQYLKIVPGSDQEEDIVTAFYEEEITLTISSFRSKPGTIFKYRDLSLTL